MKKAPPKKVVNSNKKTGPPAKIIQQIQPYNDARPETDDNHAGVFDYPRLTNYKRLWSNKSSRYYYGEIEHGGWKKWCDEGLPLDGEIATDWLEWASEDNPKHWVFTSKDDDEIRLEEGEAAPPPSPPPVVVTAVPSISKPSVKWTNRPSTILKAIVAPSTNPYTYIDPPPAKKQKVEVSLDTQIIILDGIRALTKQNAEIVVKLDKNS